MSFSKYYYVEAFSEQDLTKALGLVKSYLEKKVGPMYQEHQIDYFENKSGKGIGIRYYLKNDKSIRFNFDNNKNVISVDIWNATTKNPNARIDTEGMSIVKILPIVADELQNIKFGNFEIADEEVTTEATQVKIGDKVYPTQKEAIKDLVQKGTTTQEIMRLTGAKAPSIYAVKKEMGLVKSIKVYEASPEQIADPAIPPLERELNGIEYADLETVYDDLESLIEMIYTGKSYSLLITGMPGTGKSVTTSLKLESLMGPEGDDWVELKGVTSPYGLYQTIYNNNNKIIVMDESDDLFDDDQAVRILKAALDNKEKRNVSWNTKITFNAKGLEPEEIDALVDSGKFPNTFEFTGKMIFISNLYQDKIDTAIRSRSFHIDVTLRRKDIVVRIRQLIDKIHPNVPREEKEEVLNFMEQKADEMNSTFDMRTFYKAVIARDTDAPNWQRLVLKYT